MVYVVYDMEILTIDTLAPSIDELYITYIDDKPYLYFGEVPEDIIQLIQDYRQAQDVVELANQVNLSLTNALESDESLYQFFINLTGQVSE